MSDKGWIKLHRQILDCDIWIGFDDETVEPFDKRSAWIDLLLRANHSDKEILFNSKPMTITRGQLMTSVRKLSARWGWSVTKTYHFLDMLVKLGMITKESDYNKTLLTIVNYEIFQGDGNTEETVKEHEKNTKKTASGHKQEYKELKNEKNINKYNYGEFNNVSLTDDELSKLKERFPEDWQERIERLSAYIKSKNKRYSSHYATILNWARRDSNDKPTGSKYMESIKDRVNVVDSWV